MSIVFSWVRRVFSAPPKQGLSRNWEADRVTKEEMLTIFARELQRYSKARSKPYNPCSYGFDVMTCSAVFQT